MGNCFRTDTLFVEHAYTSRQLAERMELCAEFLDDIAKNYAIVAVRYVDEPDVLQDWLQAGADFEWAADTLSMVCAEFRVTVSRRR